MKSYLSGFIRISEPHSGFFSGPKGGHGISLSVFVRLKNLFWPALRGSARDAAVRLKLTFHPDVRYAPRSEARTQMFSGAVVAHCHL